jgi:hypothetical protein
MDFSWSICQDRAPIGFNLIGINADLVALFFTEKMTSPEVEGLSKHTTFFPE